MFRWGISLRAALLCFWVLSTGPSCQALIARRPFALRSEPLNRASVRTDLIDGCDERWYETKLDHFSWAVGPNGKSTFSIRYYVCDEHYRKADDGSDGPIFFYLGNEADVLLYLNATGLMWENAPAFGAMLIFAEHRYYGESLPFGEDTSKHMQWLTSEQAMADYARLIDHFQRTNNMSAPVIGFGGSYGGMLATWARQKYPHIWTGAIAGSAPIFTFEGMRPDIDPSFYAQGVTYDTTEQAGAAAGCTDAMRASWQALFDLADEEDGLQAESDALQICPSHRLNSTANVTAARDWASDAFDMMAMGNYPYPSSYMLNGHGELPAFPMRVACAKMMDVLAARAIETSSLARLGRKGTPGLIAPAERRNVHDNRGLVEGLAAAVGVWYNYTGELACFNPWKGVNKETQHDGDFWSWQYCTEQFMPMSKTGVNDMFWDEPFNLTAALEACQQQWGISPRVHWAATEWGGRRLESLTNVIFSNGLFDPWHGGGVMADISETVRAVIIPEGGHHLDLMFSHPDDPASVKAARNAELQAIETWILEFRAAQASKVATSVTAA